MRCAAASRVYGLQIAIDSLIIVSDQTEDGLTWWPVGIFSCLRPVTESFLYIFVLSLPATNNWTVSAASLIVFFSLRMWWSGLDESLRVLTIPSTSNLALQSGGLSVVPSQTSITRPNSRPVLQPIGHNLRA